MWKCCLKVVVGVLFCTAISVMQRWIRLSRHYSRQTGPNPSFKWAHRGGAVYSYPDIPTLPEGYIDIVSWNVLGPKLITNGVAYFNS